MQAFSLLITHLFKLISYYCWSHLFGRKAMFRCLLFSTLFLHSVTYCLDLRVMSFNVWFSGSQVDNGIQKIVKHIQLVDPDIVSLQELYQTDTQKIMDLLLTNWSIKHGSGNNAVLTKHKFDNSSFSYTSTSDHILIEITEKIKINFWAVHADWRSFGPYAVFGKTVKTVEEITAVEERDYGRASNMMDIVQSPAMQSDLESIDTVPIIVAGDFNSPSHEDWIEETRNIHEGWTIEWPATKILVDKLNMTDSFRYVNRNVTSNPGYTWSTCDKYNTGLKIDEPQDRIDFIFYRGPLIPISSRVYSGNHPITPNGIMIGLRIMLLLSLILELICNL